MLRAMVQAAEQRERLRLRDHELQEAKAAAAAEASAASQHSQRIETAKSREELTRQILGNQAAAVKSVACALQVWQALFNSYTMHRLTK